MGKMNNEIDIAYNDIHIESQYTEVRSRKTGVDITTDMDRFKMKLPVFSANMPQITEEKMATCMYDNGGIGILHRFCSIDKNIEMFIDSMSNTELTDPYCVGVSIGVQEDEKQRFLDLYKVGARLFCIDIAHGHSIMMKEMIEWVRENSSDVCIIAGNVANAEGALDLAEWGADIIKVGIGPGCFVKGTKIKTKGGYKNIERIKEGDVVLTHRGRYKKVVKTTNRKEFKKIYSINGEKCTNNHEFYVVHKKYQRVVNDDNIEQYAEWIPAEKLTKDYLLLKNK